MDEIFFFVDVGGRFIFDDADCHTWARNRWAALQASYPFPLGLFFFRGRACASSSDFCSDTAFLLNSQPPTQRPCIAMTNCQTWSYVHRMSPFRMEEASAEEDSRSIVEHFVSYPKNYLHRLTAQGFFYI